MGYSQSERYVAVGRKEGTGRKGIMKVAMGVVALGFALGSLTHRGSTSKRVSQQYGSAVGNLMLTMQATGIAQVGMLSLQKPSTSVRAVISKGIRSASYMKKFHPAIKPKASSTK